MEPKYSPISFKTKKLHLTYIRITNTITALLNIWDQKADNGLSWWTKQVIYFGPFIPSIVKINKIVQQHHFFFSSQIWRTTQVQIPIGIKCQLMVTVGGQNWILDHSFQFIIKINSLTSGCQISIFDPGLAQSWKKQIHLI